MARILSRVLRVLDDIYDVAAPAPSAPEQIDTSSSLQLVHDVSREAELGASIGVLGGFFEGSTKVNGQVGAGVFRLDLVFAELEAPFGNSPWNEAVDRDDLWFWLLDWWAVIEDGGHTNLTSWQFWIQNGNDFQYSGFGNFITNLTPQCLFHATGTPSGPGTDMGGDPGVNSRVMINAINPSRRPILIPRRPNGEQWGEIVVQRSGDLGDSWLGLRLWYGPVGVLPPGL